MTTRTLSPPRPGRDPHRVNAVASPAAVEHSLGKGEVERPFLSARQRARIEAEVERLIALLDAADAPSADMEPDAEGEEEPGEAWAQPATLNPAYQRSAIVIHRPTEAEMRAAYIRTGGRVPRNLRRGFCQGGRA